MQLPRLLVIGHVNLDIEAEDLHTFEYMEASFSKGQISTSIGGSIAHLSRASIGMCSHRSALCCVGNDYVGEILKGFVLEHYDDSIVLRKEGKSASVIPILYRENNREVIGPLVSANDLLVPSDI